MSSTLYCGVDVSYKTNRVRFCDSEGNEPHTRLTFPNDGPNAMAFLKQLLGIASKAGFDEIRVGLEATGTLAWHLAMLFGRSSSAALPLKVYVFNPKIIRNFKDTYPDRRKDDWFDARVIADRLRFGEPLPKPFDPDDRYMPLGRLTRHRFHLVHQLVREKNYFLSYLMLKCHTLAQGGPLSSPFSTTISDLVTEFRSPEEIANAPLADLARFVAEKSHNKIQEPLCVARELQKAAHHAHRLPENLKDPVNRIMASTLRNIRHLEKEIKLTSQEIEREMSGIDAPLLSVPGIGPVFAAGIIAEIGDIRHFSHDDKLAKFAGLTWRSRQSGDFQGEDSSLSRTGNPYLRYYLVEAANQVRMHDLEYAAYYQKKCAEAKIHKHKRALALTARKLVRLVFILLRENRPYIKPEKRG